MRWQHLSFLVLFAGVSAIAGCSSNSSGPSYGGEEGRKIAFLISAVNDDKSTSANLAKLFAAGSAPKDLRRYATYEYEVDGKPTVSGTTATAKIKMTREGNGPD